MDLLYIFRKKERKPSLRDLYGVKVFCANMKEVEVNKMKEHQRFPDESQKRLFNPKGYICEITDKRCVGVEKNLYSNDRFFMDMIRRCPSRKTIDDIAEKKDN